MKRKYNIEELSEREIDILLEGYCMAMEEYNSLIKATKDFMDNYHYKTNKRSAVNDEGQRSI